MKFYVTGGSLLALLLMSIAPTAVSAQSVGFFDPTKSVEQQAVAGDLACFDYYRFGSVTADLQPIIKTTIPNSEIGFVGTIVNENNYPLVNGTLLARIFKKDEAVFAQTDGNPVVDEFVVADSITLPAKGSVPMEYVWHIPASAEGGEYYATYFFLTNERYNLMGLSFTDDIVGNQANFTITNPNKSNVAKFDKTSVRINGRDHRFASFPLSFDRNDEVVITASITNPTDEEKSVPVQWVQYAWDGRLESNRRNTKTELITLAPNETKELTYKVIGQREPIVFVTALSEDMNTKSLLNIRLVRTGVEETRINFPSLTKFPLAAGEAQTLFACAHSTSVPVVPGNTLSLRLKDKTGNVIHEYTYEGDITTAMGGFGEVFTPTKNYNYVSLEAVLVRNGIEIERVTIDYDCNKIDPATCLPEDSEKGGGFFDSIMNNTMLIVVSGVILLLLVSVGLYIRQRGPTIVASLVLLIVGGALVLPFSVAQAAKTTVWDAPTIPTLTSYAQSTDFCPPSPQCNSFNPDDWIGNEIPYKWVPTGLLQNPTARVERGSNVTDGAGNTLNDGALVTVGQEVRVNPRADSGTDITWFGTGSYNDSPYGNWTGASSISCSAGNFLSSNSILTVNFDSHVALNVTPTAPVITHSGSAGLSCNGDNSVCTVTSPGTIVATVTWPATSGLFAYSFNRGSGTITPRSADWFDEGCTFSSPFKDSSTACPFNGTNSNPMDCLGSHPAYTLAVDTMSITHSLTAIATPNNAPNPPSFTGPATAEVNSLIPWTAVATDSDNDQIYYQFDWNNDGSADARMPASSLVNSGTSVNGNRTEAVPGTYTYHAQACDATLCSGWTPYTITVTPAPVPTASLTINGSTGPIVINQGSPLSVSWSSTNAASCTKFGVGWGGGQVVAAAGTEGATASVSDTYLINCGGVISSVVVTVNNQGPSAPSINGVFGGSSSAYTNQSILFTIQSIDPEGDQLSYEIDWNNDGSADASSGPLNSGFYWDQNNVWPAVGTYSIRARALDAGGGKPSAWTTHTVSISTPPPPTATLEARINGGSWETADQTINPADTIEFRWSSTYASGCSATAGPGLTVSGTGGTDSVPTPTPASSVTYSVTCNGQGGSDSDSLLITVRNRPNLATPVLFTPALGTFNPVNGRYNHIDFTFQITNNGESSTLVPSTYRFEFDENRDGTYETVRTGTIPVLSAGETSPNQIERVNNVNFNLARVRITADFNNDVTEMNEGDNVLVLDYTIPPPNPNLDLTVSRKQIRDNQTVTLNWSAGTSYPMNCRVFGPSVNVNPSGLSGSQLTGALAAKSVFTFECFEPLTSTTFSDVETVEVAGEVEEI